MFYNRFKTQFVLTFIAVLLAASGAWAQGTFEKGKLYHIYTSSATKNVVSENSGKTVTTKDFDPKDVHLYWKVSELSGSWRIIIYMKKCAQGEGPKLVSGLYSSLQEFPRGGRK